MTRAQLDGMPRVCGRCGDYVTTDEEHEDECARAHQDRVYARGLAQVRGELARARRRDEGMST